MLQILHYQILITLCYLFLTRQLEEVGGEVVPALFQNFKESALILGEKCPN